MWFWVSQNHAVNLFIEFSQSLFSEEYDLRNEKWLWGTQPIHDVKMYREGRAVCPHPGCKPHNCHILNTHGTRLQQCHFECLLMTYFYFCMYISLYRRLCLHVTKCCKYFILSSVILPLNVQGTTKWCHSACKYRMHTYTHIWKCTVVILETMVIHSSFRITSEGWEARR